MNFITLQYRLFIEYVPFLKNIFTHLIFFAVIFFVSYSVIAVLIGRWDYKRGAVIIDSTLQAKASPLAWDTVEASILEAEAIKLFIRGQHDEAIEKLEQSVELLKKWRKDV
jgi:adenine-specific DNA methylase